MTPGDARLDWGGPALVSAKPTAAARAAGVRAAALTFETRGADGIWRALPWTRADEAEASWKTESLSAPLDYRVRWRDLTGRAYRLEPVAPPRWKRATAVVREARGERRFVARRGRGSAARGAATGSSSSASPTVP